MRAEQRRPNDARAGHDGATQDRADLRIVRRRSRSLIKRGRSTRLAPVVILVGICVATIVFGVLLEQVMLAQSAFKLTQIRARLARAEATHEALLYEAAQLENPERIERFAREELGMVDAPAVSYIVARLPMERGQRLARSRPPAELPVGQAAGGAPWDGAP